MTSRLALAFVMLGLFGMAGSAAAQPADTSRPACFFSRQFENWKAPDARTIYIHVRPNRYFRLDLAAPCGTLTRPGAFLVTKLRGSTSICSALDWDLHVSQSWRGIPQACIVKKMTELTPADVAAIPAKDKP